MQIPRRKMKLSLCDHMGYPWWLFCFFLSNFVSYLLKADEEISTQIAEQSLKWFAQLVGDGAKVNEGSAETVHHVWFLSSDFCILYEKKHIKNEKQHIVKDFQ